MLEKKGVSGECHIGNSVAQRVAKPVYEPLKNRKLNNSNASVQEGTISGYIYRKSGLVHGIISD